MEMPVLQVHEEMLELRVLKVLLALLVLMEQ